MSESPSSRRSWLSSRLASWRKALSTPDGAGVRRSLIALAVAGALLAIGLVALTLSYLTQGGTLGRLERRQPPPGPVGPVGPAGPPGVTPTVVVEVPPTITQRTVLAPTVPTTPSRSDSTTSSSPPATSTPTTARAPVTTTTTRPCTTVPVAGSCLPI